MKTTDLDILLFGEELVNLCKKYKCRISGTYSDEDDDICIRLKDKCYYMESESLSIYDTCTGYDKTYIIDKYVLGLFNEEPTEMHGLNNVKVNCIIFSNDKLKATEKMNDILDRVGDCVDKVIKIKGETHSITLKDGTRYIWVKPNDNARGYRCNSTFIDRNLPLDTIKTHIMPIAYYCGKDTVEMF